MAAEILLTSAARTATATTSDVRTTLNEGASGIMLILDITATPNNTQTLTPSLQVLDPASGKYQTLTAFAALKGEEIGATATTATYVYTLYPGGSETGSVAKHEVQALPVPSVWRAVITHSSTGSWTYTLSYQSAL